MMSDQQAWEQSEETSPCPNPVCLCFLTLWNVSPEHESPYTKIMSKRSLIAMKKRCPYLSLNKTTQNPQQWYHQNTLWSCAIKLISLNKIGDDAYRIEAELTHAQVQVLLDIGVNTAIKHGVIFIDNGGMEEELEEDEDVEMVFVHAEPESKQ